MNQALPGTAPLIRGLTLWRPWPWVIQCGWKSIENRPWKPPQYLIGGYIAIHAGLRFDREVVPFVESQIPRVVPPEKDHPTGIIGAARVTGYVTESDDPWFSGPFGWVLEDKVELAEPIPRPGAQGLWRLTAQEQLMVLAAIEKET